MLEVEKQGGFMMFFRSKRGKRGLVLHNSSLGMCTNCGPYFRQLFKYKYMVCQPFQEDCNKMLDACFFR